MVMVKLLLSSFLFLNTYLIFAEEESLLEKPLIERYILDELKYLRQEMANQKVEFTQEITDRELAVADKTMSYANNTVTYFFYLITAISALLVMVGWNSLREIKDKVEKLAHEEVIRITKSYEERLHKVELEIQQKSENIAKTQLELSITNEIHSLWLKASQEINPKNKIAIYDQILTLRPNDIEALTYKADEALSLGEIEWAKSLCNKALEIEPQNSHAYYQRACAYAESDSNEAALEDLQHAISLSEALREQAIQDKSFEKLKDNEKFQFLVSEA